MNEDDIYSPPSAELIIHSEEVELAGRWARLGGSIIDGLAIMAVFFPIVYVTEFWESAISGNNTIINTLILGLIGLVIYLILNGYLLSNYGQTIGKKVVGTKIVCVKTNKIFPLSRIFFLRYLPINIAAQLPLVGQFIMTIDSLFIYRNDKRCIHDLIAGTKVIKAD